MLVDNFFSKQKIRHWSKLLGADRNISLAMVRLDLLDQARSLAGEAEFLARYLGHEELAQYNAYTLAKRKTEWLGGRIAAKRAALANRGEEGVDLLACGLPVVSADKTGRPLIKDLSGRPLVDISISHSGNLAAAMAVDQGRCGIDIQQIIPSVVRVRDRFSRQAEIDILENFSLADTDPAFPLSILWAAKEALKKALGTGASPGFLELELSSARDAGTADNCLLLDFICKDQEKPTQKKPGRPAKALAMLYEDYALALTCAPKNA